MIEQLSDLEQFLWRNASGKRVWENARLLQGLLRERGFDIGETETPITPINFSGTVELAQGITLEI